MGFDYSTSKSDRVRCFIHKNDPLKNRIVAKGINQFIKLPCGEYRKGYFCCPTLKFCFTFESLIQKYYQKLFSQPLRPILLLGEWGSWSLWECDHTQGDMYRTRGCSGGLDRRGASRCEGHSEERINASCSKSYSHIGKIRLCICSSNNIQSA